MILNEYVMLCYVMLPPSNRWMYCQYWGHADSFNQIHLKNLGATHSKQQRLHPEKGITKQRTKNKKLRALTPTLISNRTPTFVNLALLGVYNCIQL